MQSSEKVIKVEIDDVIELKRGAHYVVQLPNISVSEIIRLREDFKVLAGRAECEIIIVDSKDIEFLEQKDSIQLQAYKEMCEVYEKALRGVEEQQYKSCIRDGCTCVFDIANISLAKATEIKKKIEGEG